MILTKEDIEKPRSPRALRQFVLEVEEAVRADAGERSLGLLKKDLYKEFLDEIVPLSCFAVREYGEDVRIWPILGNQGYDATVRDAQNKECDKIEMTSPCHGKQRAADAREIVEFGCGPVRSGSPGDDFDELMHHGLETCRKKAKNDYRDCTLVVAIEPMPPFSGFESRFERTLLSLKQNMRDIDFRAKRVFLLMLPERLECVKR